MPESGSPVPVSLLDDEWVERAAFSRYARWCDKASARATWDAMSQSDRGIWLRAAEFYLLASGLPQKLAEAEEHTREVCDAYYRWATGEPGSRGQEIAHADLIDSAAELRLSLAEHRERREGQA